MIVQSNMVINQLNMTTVRIFQLSCFYCLLLMVFNSCDCPEDVYYDLPSEAIRYYDEHDTIKFFSEETQTFEGFIVCYRNESYESETSTDRCKQKFFYHSKEYGYYQDSCTSENHFRIKVETLGHSDINYWESYLSRQGSDALWSNYAESQKSTIEIDGYTYHNTIYINSVLDDSLIGIRFSYEYGVIQRIFEHTTFNLINDEIK